MLKLMNDIKYLTQGNRTTPSYVAFTDTERLIGDAAKNQVAMNPNNTIFDAKRLIGRNFDDSTVQRDIKHWPFTVVKDGNKPKIQVQLSVFSSLLARFLTISCELRSNTSVRRRHSIQKKFHLWYLPK